MSKLGRSLLPLSVLTLNENTWNGMFRYECLRATSGLSKFPLTFWIVCTLGKSTVLVIQEISLFHRFAFFPPTSSISGLQWKYSFSLTPFSAPPPPPQHTAHGSATHTFSNYDSVTSSRQTRLPLTDLRWKEGRGLAEKVGETCTAFQEGEQTGQRQQSGNKPGVLKNEGECQYITSQEAGTGRGTGGAWCHAADQNPEAQYTPS